MQHLNPYAACVGYDGCKLKLSKDPSSLCTTNVQKKKIFLEWNLHFKIPSKMFTDTNDEDCMQHEDGRSMRMVAA